MPTLKERLDTMVVKVTSPDNQIMAKLENREEITLRFRPNTYREYNEQALAHQLSRLATLVWTGYQRGYRMAVAEVNGEEVKERVEHWDANRRRYQAALETIVAEGYSHSGCLHAKSKGMAFWKVEIAEGTVAHLGEEEFLMEARSALRALLADSKVQVTLLKDKHFGLNIPAAWRKKLND